jgi:signal peptidase II
MRWSSFPPWIWAPLVLILDFVTKRLVLANREILLGKVEILGDFLRFIYVRNPGPAMGLFPVGRAFLVTVSVLATFFLIYLYRSTDRSLALRRGALAAILGGAVGNLIDRVFYEGKVVDFIDFGIGGSRFYTFNIADIGVTVGGAIFFLCILLEGWRQKKAHPEALAQPEVGIDPATDTDPGSADPAPSSAPRVEND